MSYRHIGEARHPTETAYANVPASRCRFILAHQYRPLSDALFQYLPLPQWLRAYGDFHFVACANTTGRPEDESEVAGVIYIFKSHSDWEDKAKEQVITAVNAMHDTQSATDNDRDDRLERLFQSAQNAAASSADLSTEFHLCRSGEVFFGIPKYLDLRLKTASDSYAQEEGHDFTLAVANQAYSFLRDIAHTHQHHDPKADTILILQNRGTDPLRWRTNIIYSLHYYIVRLKRHGKKAELIRAMGSWPTASHILRLRYAVSGEVCRTIMTRQSYYLSKPG